MFDDDSSVLMLLWKNPFVYPLYRKLMFIIQHNEWFYPFHIQCWCFYVEHITYYKIKKQSTLNLYLSFCRLSALSSEHKHIFIWFNSSLEYFICWLNVFGEFLHLFHAIHKWWWKLYYHIADLICIHNLHIAKEFKRIKNSINLMKQMNTNAVVSV